MPFIEQGNLRIYVEPDGTNGNKPLLGPLAHLTCGCRAQEFQPLLEEVAERTGIFDPLVLVGFVDLCKGLLKEGKLANFLTDLDFMVNRFGESVVVAALDVGCIKRDGKIMRGRLRDRVNEIVGNEEV